jgi:hypothetical protein
VSLTSNFYSVEERQCSESDGRVPAAFNSQGLEQLAAAEAVEATELVLDATEAVN